MSCGVMAIIAGTMAGLAAAVRTGSQHANGEGLAAQHAQVTLDRIGRLVREATASESFPGLIVLAQTVGTRRYPDTLVIWHPTGPAVAPGGLPRLNELVVICPHPNYPGRIVEITAPTNTSAVPAITDVAAWTTLIEAMKRATTSRVVTLSDLVRVAGVGGSTDPADQRAAVRFAVRVLPSHADWSAFRAGTLAWNDLAWAQGIRGSRTGQRQVWLRTELQLLPGPTASAQQAIPFLDSAALYYELTR